MECILFRTCLSHEIVFRYFEKNPIYVHLISKMMIVYFFHHYNQKFSFKNFTSSFRWNKINLNLKLYEDKASYRTHKTSALHVPRIRTACIVHKNTSFPLLCTWTQWSLVVQIILYWNIRVTRRCSFFLHFHYCFCEHTMFA